MAMWSHAAYKTRMDVKFDQYRLPIQSWKIPNPECDDVGHFRRSTEWK